MTGDWLTSARVTGVWLTGDWLTSAGMTGARMTGAWMTGDWWIIARLEIFSIGLHLEGSWQ